MTVIDNLSLKKLIAQLNVKYKTWINYRKKCQFNFVIKTEKEIQMILISLHMCCAKLRKQADIDPKNSKKLIQKADEVEKILYNFYLDDEIVAIFNVSAEDEFSIIYNLIVKYQEQKRKGQKKEYTRTLLEISDHFSCINDKYNLYKKIALDDPKKGRKYNVAARNIEDGLRRLYVRIPEYIDFMIDQDFERINNNDKLLINHVKNDQVQKTKDPILFGIDIVAHMRVNYILCINLAEYESQYDNKKASIFREKADRIKDRIQDFYIILCENNLLHYLSDSDIELLRSKIQLLSTISKKESSEEFDSILSEISDLQLKIQKFSNHLRLVAEHFPSIKDKFNGEAGRIQSIVGELQSKIFDVYYSHYSNTINSIKNYNVDDNNNGKK